MPPPGAWVGALFFAISLAGFLFSYAFTFAGQPVNPAWYHNLKANPKVTVEVGDEVYEAIATEVTGAERDRIYAEQARRYPGFAEYQQKTTRQIPVVVLERLG